MPVVKQANGGQSIPPEVLRERELHRRLSVLSELDKPLDRLAKWVSGGKKEEGRPQMTGDHLRRINESLPKVKNDVSRQAGGLSEIERATVDHYAEFRHRTIAEGLAPEVHQIERARMLNLAQALEMMPVRKGLFASLFSRGQQRTYRDVLSDVLSETSAIKYATTVREQAPHSREVKMVKRDASLDEAVYTAVYSHALSDGEGGARVRRCLDAIQNEVLKYGTAVAKGGNKAAARESLMRCVAENQPKSTSVDPYGLKR